MIKACPIMVAGANMARAICIEEHCAWWSKYAGCCSVPLIADILADSTICQSVWNEGGDGK